MERWILKANIYQNIHVRIYNYTDMDFLYDTWLNIIKWVPMVEIS